MTFGGWILLLVSWSLIIGLNLFCFKKVFGKKDGEDAEA
jgi:hypothetical protein